MLFKASWLWQQSSVQPTNQFQMYIQWLLFWKINFNHFSGWIYLANKQEHQHTCNGSRTHLLCFYIKICQAEVFLTCIFIGELYLSVYLCLIPIICLVNVPCIVLQGNVPAQFICVKTESAWHLKLKRTWFSEPGCGWRNQCNFLPCRQRADC